MKIALIDSLALIYASKYAIPKLYSEDQETGIIYGFFRYLLSLQKQFNFNQFIFCNDSSQSKRKEIYKDYKGQRNNLDETRILVNSQFEIIKNEILPQIGFRNLFETEGLEADDIIASLCQTKNPDDEYIIISRDQDLYQLLNTNISQYDFISKKIITVKIFRDKYEINPIQWGIVKTIGGCKSDHVPGIPGVGEKTICKYLNNQLKPTTKAYQKIESDTGRSLTKFNEKLVILPFENTPHYRIVEDEILFKSLTEMFISYQFNSQLTNTSLDMWRESFNWVDIKQRKTKLSDFF